MHTPAHSRTKREPPAPDDLPGFPPSEWMAIVDYRHAQLQDEIAERIRPPTLGDMALDALGIIVVGVICVMVIVLLNTAPR